MSKRSGHYFQWFIVFGLIAGIVSFLGNGLNIAKVDSEAWWLLGAGILGLLIAHNSVKNGEFARFYDYIIGIIFMLAGLIGIGVHIGSLQPTITGSLGTVMTGSVSNDTAHLLGLSLALFPAIVHLLLGFTSFRHGMEGGKKK